MTVNTLAGERLDESGVERNSVDRNGVDRSGIGQNDLGDEVEAAGRARAATVRALQQVFEVLDGRRPVAHLLRCVTGDVAEQLLTVLRRPSSGNASPAVADTARLVRVHLQIHGPRCADYFGTFVRGERVRAVAGRIELASVPAHVHPGRPLSGRERSARARTQAEDRWVIVELSIV
ncbi:Rv3235 family protein [Gordonia sp. (in: high G+C Gram-positive bacteria)]|uniref:Rv3235 family protein n=1 Tax=Gordonia sp. (in: high G+C Gram-positive bacteria) TaxID=84139 RepID=UPI0016A35887|nr:Rv3235 family protein [Gordonia sp. (in: high G+C Gram-positive bacteria)]NLG45779.1 hypothetical protein [Gordonia sp. (in: high G+C Gram-positive bacteria)]